MKLCADCHAHPVIESARLCRDCLAVFLRRTRPETLRTPAWVRAARENRLPVKVWR